MKFFDFLQDVTLSTVFVALSLFLIDQPGPLNSATAATTNPQAEMLAGFADANLARPASDIELPDDTLPLSERSLVGESTVADSTTTTPSPLDLDSLEQALTEQLGLRPFGDSPSVETARDRTRPTPIVVEKRPEWATSRPAPSSRPLNDVKRQFDERNLFDSLQQDNYEFGSRSNDAWSRGGGTPPPASTRPVGPVEILELPSF